MANTLSGEWELVDDDGFIYKRRKRRPVLSTPAVGNPVLPRYGEQGREASLRQETMSQLLAQKRKYSAEIEEWEKMLEKCGDDVISKLAPESSPLPEKSISSSAGIEFGDLKGELFELQVEAYEASIDQLQTLLEHGENICRQIEEATERDHKRLKNSLVKEINKVTPRSIIHALTTEQRDLPTPVLLKHLVPDYS